MSGTGDEVAGGRRRESTFVVSPSGVKEDQDHALS